MQKGDPNDALKPCHAGSGQPVSALVPGSLQQHLIQLQTMNTQGQESPRQATHGILQVAGVKDGTALTLTAAPTGIPVTQRCVTATSTGIPVTQRCVTATPTGIPVTQRSVVVTSSNLAQLFTPTSSITGSLTFSPMVVSPGTPIIPVQTSPLQRQLGDPGVVSPVKSARNVVGHIGSVVPGHEVTMSGHSGSELHQQSLVPLPQSHSLSASGATVHHQLSLPLTPTSSVSASGGTIHHHGQSPVRGTVVPHSNLQRISTMNQQSTQRGSSSETGGTISGLVTPKGLLDMKAFTGVGVSALPRSPGSAGPSPRKKLKLEEKPPATSDIDRNRKVILDHIHKEMLEIKENYIEHLSELFFLQSGNNMIDYMAWKKRPTPQLVAFLKSSNLDSDEEDIQEMRISDEVKILATSGSNQPLATPVAISTTLPPSVAALTQQGSDGKKLGGRHGMVFLHAPTSQQLTQQSVSGPGPGTALGGPLGLNVLTKASPQAHVKSIPTSASVSTTAHSHSLTTTCTTQASPNTPTSQLHSQLVKSSTDTKPVTVHSRAVHTPISSPAIQKQQSITAMYESTILQGSQEAIVERAKQEAQVMQRVAELRKDGLWSSRKLAKVQEPQRNKAHWDYLLEEMMWLSADFLQERKWKKAAARKVAKMVQKYHQELEQKEIKAEKEEGQRLKKIASQIAKQVKEFWTNIEKVVQFKQQTLLEEKRKKALDLHLNFIVDQTEKYSSWLTEGLAAGSTGGSSIAGSVDGISDRSGDDEFCPEGSESDDEETIDIEEHDGLDEKKTLEEIEALQKESELPLEDILKDLPKEILEQPAQLFSDDEKEKQDSEHEEKDEEFTVNEDEVDIEDTIAEQEKVERKDHSKEINELQMEGEMSMEELITKYGGAYDSDFEMPETDSESEGETEDETDDDDGDDEEEEEEEDDEEEDIEVDNDDKDTSDVGLEFLMKTEESTEESEPAKPEGEDEKGPSKEITDIAAEALSVQPKGYTLETAEVKTSIPFLLKHTLREYQHVGLDWMATMYEKKLNGILADEMGLGKTIQTIALLAHFACEKGIWGPHLIVVPTSVMLNWEMEFKKWCPAFKILTYYGTQKERKQKRMGWTKTNAFHVCITSYKLVIQDHQSFRRKKWKYFILDEAQNIKNFKSQRWQTLLNFQSQRRLLLTGTPLQNSLMELWSLMHFLMPNVFQSHKEFKEWFANPLTGMIEGSHEYNENLIYRLHKVLRPFLLRRLKADVEKQMPKKYEHVIMCSLSKRQRYLYDDFMSQRKTKETLASGQFMSVINILMQLRKVCNHPSLFDPRPIVSPFQTEGIVYHTASLVLQALEKDPLSSIDLSCWYPGLADMEKDLPAFIAHRVKKLQTPRKLIEEIDSYPDPPPRPPAGKLKPVVFRGVSPMIQSGRSSPISVSSSRPASPMPPVRPPPSQVLVSTPQPVITGTIQNTSGMAHSITSQPITVQIQQTDQGTRLMIPTGHLSQLPAGFIQIVQTSQGQQLIATSTPSASIPSVISLQNCISATTLQSVNSLPALTNASPAMGSVRVTSVSPQVRTTSQVQLPTTPLLAGAKPVMRVSPLVTEQKAVPVATPTTVPQVSRTEELPSTTVKLSNSLDKPFDVSRSASPLPVPVAALKAERLQKKKSELYMESLDIKRQRHRKGKLDYLTRLNKIHCEMKPVYGEDLCNAVDVFSDLEKTLIKDNTWHGHGLVLCNTVHTRKHLHTYDTLLSDLVHTPHRYLTELTDMLDRYVFVTPTATAPPISMHVSHPPPSYLIKQHRDKFMYQKEFAPRTACLGNISTKMTVQFPDPRLIQYDCGKLQSLDILLRRLKTGAHRVLIFTQMTKMLNIFEAFLNYHGHRYLRLDGTTKVEQRQALMERFNADKRIFVFILSTRSGGIGVNLTGADTVIFYDSDWNPTMDAQAQDRCHRIGQTRDVHIYRLISEKTVEENILKKANQKRLLGDLAIEGGNFTTAFFKSQTISELFSEPSGLQSLVDVSSKQEIKETVKVISQPKPKPKGSETNIVAQFEQALGKAEDETDVMAADLVKAEQKAELAEFDESIPWDEREAEQKREEEEMTRAEQELSMLDKELSPVERYAVCFMENTIEPFEDELQIAEEDIENAKKDWELARLKALKEEEELRAEIEEDEMLYTYARDDSYSQVFVSDDGSEQMPLWAPPTPPQDDNDVYIDQCLLFLYEPHIMTETQLPPVYVKKEHKKPKIESITTRKQKQRKEEQPRVPRSLFDRPNAALLKIRREAKLQKLKQGLIKPYRPVQPMLSKPTAEPPVDHPDWLIHEDWALLQAVQSLFDVPLNLMVVSPAHLPNWDLVADVVNTCSRVYRSAKQCRNRYENSIIPREEGRIMYDMNPKKQKKAKGLYKVPTKSNRPMRTSQLFVQDSNGSVTFLHSLRFDSMKTIATKRPATMRQTLINPTLKNPKHAHVLAENNITYEQPLNPMMVAENRAQRIQREKKNQAQAAAAEQRQSQQAQGQGQTVTVTAQPQVTTNVTAVQPVVVVSQPQQIAQIGPVVTTAIMTAATVAKPVGQVGTAVSLSRAVGGTGNFVVNTASGVNTNTFAAINRRMTQATPSINPPTTVTVTGTLCSAVRAQRAAGTQLTIQEIAVPNQGQTQQVAVTAQTQARPQLQTNMAAQLAAAQRLPTGTTVTAVPQQLSTKNLMPTQQLQLLRQRSLQQQQQQQQFRMQKLNVTPEQLRQQQQNIKRLTTQAQTATGQKVLTQQLVGLTQVNLPGLTQAPKPSQLKTATGLTQELLRMKQQQLTHKAQVQAGVQQVQLSTSQIIAQAQVPVGQTVGSIGTSQPGGTTLVKAVTTAAGGLTIPVSTVNINVNIPGQKTALAKAATVTQGHPQQLQKQMLLQHRKVPQMQQPQRLAALGQVGKSQIPGAVQIIQQPTGQRLTVQTVQQLHQLVKQQQQQQPGVSIQQIIHTSQPTIIATVPQGQPTAQMITKVLGAASSQNPTTQIQALSTGTPISVSHATSHQPVATLTVATPSNQSHQVLKPVTVTTVSADSVSQSVVQVSSVPTVSQSKLTAVPHNIASLHQITTSAQVLQRSQPGVTVTVTPTQLHTSLVGQSVTTPIAATIQRPTPTPTSTLSLTPTSLQTHTVGSNTPVTQMVVPSLSQNQAKLLAPQSQQSSPQVFTTQAINTPSPLPHTTQIQLTSPVATVVQTQGQSQTKTAPYAMRTRNTPKHTRTTE